MNLIKKLWIKVKDTETLQLIIDTLLSEYLEKYLIESFGIFDESCLEDYDFLDDKCVFITFDDNFDYLSFSEAVSTIFDTPLLCYIAGSYFYFDENHIYSTIKNPFEIDDNQEIINNTNIDFDDNKEKIGCLPDSSCCSDDCFCAKSEENKENYQEPRDELITSIEVKEFDHVNLDEVGFGKIEFLSDEFEVEIKPKGISAEELDEIFKQDSKSYQNSNNLDVFNFFEEKEPVKENENAKIDNISDDISEFKITDEPDLNLFDESFSFESEADANSCCSEENCDDCEGCSWDFSEDFDYNDILNSVEKNNVNTDCHFECICEDKLEGEVEMSNNKYKETSFIDNEALTEFESINIDSDKTNKLDSKENIFENDLNENNDLNALINENEYEQIFSDLSNLNSQDNYEVDDDISSIKDKDLITAEELEKILASNDELTKNLFVDDENTEESFSYDENFVDEEPFNFEEFFTEITKENVSKNFEVEQNIEFNAKANSLVEENNFEEMLKFSDAEDEIRFDELPKDMNSNSVSEINSDLLDLKSENWNSQSENTVDFIDTEEINTISNLFDNNDLNSLNESDWNKQSFDSLQESTNLSDFKLENWSEFKSVYESEINKPKEENIFVESNLELTKEIEEFFKADTVVDDSQDFTSEFILPTENKEENQIAEDIVIDNEINNEKQSSTDFFINFEPVVENINYVNEEKESIVLDKNDINNNIEEYKFEPDISDNKIVIDKKVTNDLQKFLSELKLEKEKLKQRKLNLEKRTSKVKSMFRDINNSNGYIH